MSVRRYPLALSLWVLASTFAAAQSVYERELAQISRKLIDQASEHLIDHNIAFGDILDGEGQSTPLGDQLKEELSFELGVADGGNFTLVDRSHLETLIDEADLGTTGLINDTTVVSLGKVSGISAIVYGTLYRHSQRYQLILKYCLLESQNIKFLLRGYISRVPSLDAKYSVQKVSEEVKEDEEIKQTMPSPFRSGSIEIIFTGCTRNGAAVDCSYTVVSHGRGQTLTLYREGTYLQTAHGRSMPRRLFFNDRQSAQQLTYSLRGNTSYTAVIRYGPIDVSGRYRVNLHGKAPSIYDFNYSATPYP